MPSLLLPPAQAAFNAVNTSIPIASAAITAGSGYGAAIAPVTANLTLATTSITITPAMPMRPPARLTIPNCNNALAQITTINASIASAIAASIVLSGLPDPTTFPALSATVVNQISTLAPFINTTFVIPQL